MTNVLQLPSTPVPASPGDHAPSLSLSALLGKRFLRGGERFSCLASPTSDLRAAEQDYTVIRIKGRAFYIPSAGQPKTLCASPISVLSNQTAPLTQGGALAPLQVSDQVGSIGRESRRGLSPSGTWEDSRTPGVDRTHEDLELNQAHWGGKQLSEVLNEDANEEFNEAADLRYTLQGLQSR
ncbi:hypothetical protein CRUP_031385 [Coryphaenoides rupestris]|nr:hypothetical protein CRUP_031385 [Coryphaenoides rupestris]